MSGSYTIPFMYVGDYFPIKWAYHISSCKIENNLLPHKVKSELYISNKIQVFCFIKPLKQFVFL